MDAILKWITENLPLFIGIVAAVAFLIVLIIVIAVHAAKKKKRNRPKSDPEALSLADTGGEAVSETTATYEVADTAVGDESPAPAEEQEIVYDGVEITEAEERAEEKPCEKTFTEKTEDTPAVSEADRPVAEEKPCEESFTEINNVPAAQETEKDAVIEKALSAPETQAEEKPAKKPSAKKSAAKTAPKQTRRATGKWTIEFKSAGEYMAKLSASNGEVMLSSEIYSSEDGARNGIGTIVKCIESGKFVIYQDKNKNYYYKLKTANNRLLCVGEIYRTKDQCEKAVETVKRIAASAVVYDDVAEGAKYIDYTPAKVENYEIKKGVRGKWRVETSESGKYSAKLYASNGQLMLATEEVSLRKTAENAIDSVKRNSAAGNFIIDRDKFGRYYYKLRNPQMSVICIGEAYDSLDSCISALESVRRFAATAVLPNETD